MYSNRSKTMIFGLSGSSLEGMKFFSPIGVKKLTLKNLGTTACPLSELYTLRDIRFLTIFHEL